MRKGKVREVRINGRRIFKKCMQVRISCENMLKEKIRNGEAVTEKDVAQMANYDFAVSLCMDSWCSVFALQKSDRRYDGDERFEKERFLAALEQKGISIEKLAARMLDFRDRHKGDWRYVPEDAVELFEQAGIASDVYDEFARERKA